MRVLKFWFLNFKTFNVCCTWDGNEHMNSGHSATGCYITALQISTLVGGFGVCACMFICYKCSITHHFLWKISFIIYMTNIETL
jgi:hypothetical protein